MVTRWSRSPHRGHRVTLSRSGALSSPEERRAVETLAEQIRTGEAAHADFAPVERVLKSMPTEDPNRNFVAALAAQAYGQRLTIGADRADGERALRLMRTVNTDSGDRATSFAYERGRIAWEIGRRLSDPALIDEAFGFYGKALEGAPKRRFKSRTEQKRLLLDNLMDCASYYEGLGEDWLKGTASGPVKAFIVNLPLDTVPVGESCVGPVAKSGESYGPPFYFEILGLRAAARFRRAGAPSMDPSLPRRNSRGRELDGFHMIGHQTQLKNSTDLVALTLAVPGLGTEPLETLRNLAPDLHKWGERFSRWLDVLSDPPPPDGASIRVPYIYAYRDVNDDDFIPLPASEPGSLWLTEHRAARVLTRAEIAAALWRLGDVPVPVAVEMYRLSQHSLADDELRRAVIEAGTAAEAALGALYDLAATSEPRKPTWTLGTLVSKASKVPGLLPDGLDQERLVRELVRPRNDAVHRSTVTRNAVQDACKAAEAIVDALLPVTTSDPWGMASRLADIGQHLTEFRTPVVEVFGAAE